MMVEMQQDIPCEKQSSTVKMELSEGKSDTAFHQHKQGRQHWEEVFQFSCLRQEYLAIFRHTLYMNPSIIPLTQIDFKCLQGRTYTSHCRLHATALYVLAPRQCCQCCHLFITSYGNTLLQIRVPVSRKVLKTSRDGDHTTSKQSVVLPDYHHREKVFLSIKSYPALLQLVPVVSHSPSVHGGRVHINPSKLSAESLSSYFAINQ